MAVEQCQECHVPITPGDGHPLPWSAAHGYLNSSRAAALQEQRRRAAARKPAPPKAGRLVASAFLDLAELAADGPEQRQALAERQRAAAGRAKAAAALERRDHGYVVRSNPISGRAELQQRSI